MKKWSEFEREIEQTNAYYQRKGRGAVAKLPNGVQTVKQAGTIKNFRVKTPCDFIGHVDGVPVAFDVKTTSRKTAFPIFTRGKNNKETYSLKKHQAMFLSQFDNGGRAYVLIYSIPKDVSWLVPIEEYLMLCQAMKNSGKKSIRFSHFIGYEIERKGMFWDYAEKIIGG